MTRFSLFMVVCLILGNGCTKITVEETLPDISNISPDNMKSELDRISIVSDSFDYMYSHYVWDITVSANVEYFDKNDVMLFEKDAQIEIKGAGSAKNPERRNIIACLVSFEI